MQGRKPRQNLSYGNEDTKEKEEERASKTNNLLEISMVWLASLLKQQKHRVTPP